METFDPYMVSGGKRLRCGYTTGTCAALAAEGAARLLLFGIVPEKLSILTPEGWRVEVTPKACRLSGEEAVCAVEKDAGDDPDVTGGLLIYASVRKTRQGISIDGGEGVGRVTKAGLDQPVGAAAINSVPRRMITSAVAGVCEEAEYSGGLSVTIFVPGGEEAAKRTYRKFGKVRLNDANWTEIYDDEEANYNFFKVTVEMK